MFDMFIISFSSVLTLILTIWVRGALVKRALLDHPNERSSHATPVPRGGGWAVLAALVPGLAVTAILQKSLAVHGWIIAGVVVLALVSWRDDREGVRAGIRLAAHIVAAIVGSLAFAHEQTLFGGALPFWADRAVMIVGWAWFMNLYNFMDGIDGITGVETIALATGTCLLMSAAGAHDPFIATLTLLLTGSCLGFLALNWHPAKIFLGDVGSVPLGFLTGYGLLALALNGYPAPALILPLYYLADSGITLAKRAARREKIWQAHRQHFYQRAALVAGRHDTVVYWIMLADLALIIAALIAILYPGTGLAVAVLIVAILLYRMHKAGMTPGPKI